MDRARTGEIEVKTLALTVVEQLAVIDDATKGIIAKIEADTDHIMGITDEELGLVKGALAELEKNLRLLVTFFETSDPQAFQDAYDGIFALGQKGRLIFEAYTQAEAEMGPTDMPMLNVLNALCEGFIGSAPVADAIRHLVASISINARMAAHELSGKTDGDEYARGNLIGVYSDFAAIVCGLDEALDLGSGNIRAQMKDIFEAGTKLREAIEAYSMSMATSGPSKMASANLIINLAGAWKKGDLDGESLLKAMDQFRADTEALWREIESLAKISSDTDKNADIADQMTVCRKAFEDHFKALDLLAAAVNGEDDKLEEALRSLAKAADDLFASKERFESIGEQSGKVPCVRCGTYNDPGNRTCTGCGARMLSTASAMGSASSSTMSFQENIGEAQQQYEGENELVMTKNLLVLFETVNKAAEGTISADEYNEVLDWFRGLVEDNLLNMAPEPEIDESGFDAEELEQLQAIKSQIAAGRDEIEAGAQSMIDAIEHLRVFASDNNSVNLVEGVRELRDASIKVQHAAKSIEEIVNACRIQAGMPTLDGEDGENAEEEAGESALHESGAVPQETTDFSGGTIG